MTLEVEFSFYFCDAASKKPLFEVAAITSVSKLPIIARENRQMKGGENKVNGFTPKTFYVN